MNKGKRMKVFSIVSTLLLIAQIVCAQRYQLTDSVEVYGDDVKKLLTKTNDSTAIKIGDQFAGLWQELSASQRDTIMATSAQMLAKNFQLTPFYVNYYAAINVAVDSAQLSQQNLNELLSMLLQTTKHYNRQEFGYTVATLRDFFQREAIYYANYNQLYARNGKYSFSFVAPPRDTYVPEADFTSEVENEGASGGSEDDGWGEGIWGDPESSDEWESAEEDSEWNDGWGWDEETNDEEASTAATEQESLQITDYIVEETIQPELQGPIMHLDNMDLTFTTTFDSANLSQTNGELMLHKHILVGEGGRFDWVTAGLSSDSVYYTFEKYNFNTRVPRLNAENGHMTHKGKVKEPVKGAFQFASQKHSSYETARYPRFMSYKSDIEIDIYNEKSVNNNVVSYRGGFSMLGSKVTSASLMEGEAIVEIHEGGKKKIRAISRRFNVSDSLLTSPKSTITIYQRSDSIYHPAVEFKYAMDSSLLTILSNSGRYKHTPFMATFLKMDIQADIMRWDLRTDSLNISTLTARDKVPVVFESYEYFNEEAFDALGQMYGFHPLIMAVGYGRKNNTLSFYVYDLARDTRQNEKTIRAAMLDLMTRGYIDYEPASGLVTLKKKGIHYTLAKARRVDYDNLMMPSFEEDGPNATIILDGKELVMRGIKKFNISEDLDVAIEPRNNEVTMLGERDFRFNGKLQSGNVEFVGEGFTFSYDSFKVNLPKIDSISFFIPNEKGERTKINNSLQNAAKSDQEQSFADQMGEGFKQTSGTLYINDPKNKSARKSLPDYPKFNAENGAIVYFDKETILNGAYDRSIYFVIPPFAIDSLSNADPSSIGFEGTLYSDILPPIEETLVVMPDNSMGFEHKVATQGYNLYNGSATYKNELRLDGQGLRGRGTIDFLTTTLESEEFIFYIDSVTTVGTAADIKEGALGTTTFPQAYVEDYNMLWLPGVDSMYISNNAEPFDIYHQTASLDGSVILSEKIGLLGKGRLFTRGSEASSEEMTFEQTRFDARNATFEIKSDNPEKPALAGNDVFLDFDLEQNIANISPEEEGEAAIAFPYAQFKTSITNAVWNLEEETVKMSKPEDIDIENSYFYATRKDLDSLWFNAEEAIYRIPLLQLDIFGVPYITTADAKVIPENNQLQVLENAKFETFQNATLVIDTLNEYHRLTNGTIDILSRNEFKGKAYYELIAATDTFSIEMNNFEKDIVEDRKQVFYHTVANGRAEADQNIIISPGMFYRGNVRMHAAKEALELDGEVKLDFKRRPDYDTWIAYASEAGQKKLEFNFNESLTSEGEPLTAGLHMSSKDNSLYSTFVWDRHSPDDFDFFNPRGLLSYDEEKDEYIIRSQKKENRGALSGEVFTYNENQQTVSFEGPVDFMPYKSESFSLEATVIGEGKLETNEFKLDAFMAFNIDLPSQAVDIMGADLNESLNKSGAQSATSDRTTLLFKLAEMIGDQAARDWDKSSVSNYTSLVSMSGKLEKTLVFADVDMAWSDAHKAWYSTSPLGLSNVREQDINGSMTGFLEIKPLEMGGMMVNLFMQATPDSWYYFSYQNNRLAVWAYDEEFCDVIGSKSEIGKVDGGEYAFFLSDIAETIKYVNRFRKDYLGIDEQYNFNTATPVIAEENVEEEKKEADRDGF
ncbi:hypothetical protein OKW21_005885 [Catalinimonas alkaloidigena]|uniref:hypothetical protein n=1 Tax=Catalinimonas alkaloidigena TaxID=1075417 RepID=UPI002404A8A9|nr:hypothetical protein [Catalinimonas alkaloidigena]MDF9800622.1 hypothetical protein [Catalinimonas alkaloidigena]